MCLLSEQTIWLGKADNGNFVIQKVNHRSLRLELEVDRTKRILGQSKSGTVLDLRKSFLEELSNKKVSTVNEKNRSGKAISFVFKIVCLHCQR